VRYDQRGSGLSDRNRTDFSPDSELRDLETVVDHLGLKRLALLGISMGGPTAVAYAARHPRRVTHLILYGTYARGEAIATEELKNSLISLVIAHWGLGSKILADLFFPGVDGAGVESFARYQRECADPQMAAQLMGIMYKTDVAHLLSKLRVPALVLHRSRERSIPFRLGRELASLIPNSRFIPLEGSNHPPQYGDAESVLRAIAAFLGDPVTDPQGAEGARPAGLDSSVVKDDPVAREARSFITGLDWVALSRYRVVGDYTRYDEAVRNALEDVRQRICAGFDRPSRKRENHLVWAAPGGGKTYFVQEVAASLSPMVQYQESNLAKCNREEFLAGLAQLGGGDRLCLCLIDEVDAKPDQAWPYEVLLPCLDATADGRARLVFVLAGSSGSSLVDMKKQIASRAKGMDLLSRIPSGNEYEIPPMKLGDRVLVVLSQFRRAGQEMGRQVHAVEKLGLYYVALNSRLTSARQLRELAVRAIERLAPSDDRVKYDHLFGPGDPKNKAFWMESLPAAAALAGRFVNLED